MTDLGIALILGVVEGVTEYLPVSSTGHLIVAGNLLSFTGPKAGCFEVFIQLGAILAVVVLFWNRFVGLIPCRRDATQSAEGFVGLRGLLLLGLTTLPALVAGYCAHKVIKEYLFQPWTVAWALAVGGVGIIMAERFKPPPRVVDLNGLGYGQAFSIGLFQCLSLWPGISRAAATIIGGLFSGLHRSVAAEYSFLAAVPVMIAATSYDLYKTWGLLELADLWMFAVGFAVSFVSAAAAVKTFVSIVQRWSLLPFAWYRIAIAPVIYLLMG
jgi:undecaprenyl-diphosphatase